MALLEKEIPYRFSRLLFISCLIFITIGILFGFQNSYAQTPNSTNISKNNVNTSDTLKSSELVDFASNEYQIRGHLNASIMNKEIGNGTLALAHASHPVAEVYALIAQPVANANSTLNQTLYASLLELPELVGNSTTQEYINKAILAANIVDQSSKEVIPESDKNNATFNLMVIGNLLNVAAEEYEEAITNGSITAMVEYQDSQAFIQQAESLLQSLNSTNQEVASQTQILNPLFASLNQKIDEIANPEDVKAAIDEIINHI